MLGNKTNVFLVALAALVLVAGTALPVVHASDGDGDTTDTDVFVDVQQVDPEIEITSYTEDIDYYQDVEIEVEVTAPAEDDATDTFDIEFDYTGGETVGETDDGDAEIGIDSTELDWEDGIGTYTETFSPDTGEGSVGWRYGEFTATATVHSEYDDTYEDDDTEVTNVLEHTVIESADDGYAEINPGESVEGDDFYSDGFGDGETPGIQITSNAIWTLEFDDDYRLEHEEGDALDGGDTDGGYDGATEDLTEMDPTDGGNWDITYYVNVPYGHDAGEYSTTIGGGTTPTHTLSNAEGE